MDASLPLSGITVIALEHAVAAPFATRQLADLGARVIKIERPGVGDFARAYDQRVDGLASYFVWLNRSKESLTLDLKHPEAGAILTKLMQGADVLVQNLGPGAAARLGLSAEALRPAHPGLIVCDISGYGPDGPYRDKKAYDLLIQAETGLLSITGTPGEMARAGISVADIAAGMYAYSNILVALIQRGRPERGGRGGHITVSMLEALGEWMGNPMYYAYKDSPQAARTGASHPSVQPYGPFRTGDGKAVMFGVQNEREWTALCRDVLRQPELATDSRFCSNVLRTDNREALKAVIEAAFSGLSAEEADARLERANIGNARVNDMAGFWHHPQLAARDRWREISSPAGMIPALLPPGTHDSFACHMGPVPALGQHTTAILGELGYAQGEIDRLRENGAI